nr:YlxR family protein [Pseudonocardia endophytica]
MKVRRRRPELPYTRTAPVRTCVGCRSRELATDLLRVVAVKGRLVPDPRRRLPGRGAWLHPVRRCLDRAERRSAFTRALRVPGPLDATEVRARLQDGEGPRQDGGHSITRSRGTPGPTPEESTVDQS